MLVRPNVACVVVYQLPLRVVGEAPGLGTGYISWFVRTWRPARGNWARR
jgi:hypothetical protein